MGRMVCKIDERFPWRVPPKEWLTPQEHIDLWHTVSHESPLCEVPIVPASCWCSNEKGNDPHTVHPTGSFLSWTNPSDSDLFGFLSWTNAWVTFAQIFPSPLGPRQRRFSEAKGHPGAQDWDDLLSKARFEPGAPETSFELGGPVDFSQPPLPLCFSSFWVVFRGSVGRWLSGWEETFQGPVAGLSGGFCDG